MFKFYDFLVRLGEPVLKYRLEHPDVYMRLCQDMSKNIVPTESAGTVKSFQESVTADPHTIYYVF
jgi:hypothetical protein